MWDDPLDAFGIGPVPASQPALREACAEQRDNDVREASRANLSTQEWDRMEGDGPKRQREWLHGEVARTMGCERERADTETFQGKAVLGISAAPAASSNVGRYCPGGNCKLGRVCVLPATTRLPGPPNRCGDGASAAV